VARDHTVIDLERSFRHPFDGKLAHAFPCGGSEAQGERAIADEARDLRAERARVSRRREQSVHPGGDDLRDATGGRGRDRLPEEQRVEEHGPHPLLARAEDGDVGRGEQRVGVRAIPCNAQRILKSTLAHGTLDVGAERSVADEQCLKLRDMLVSSGNGVDEVERILMWDELRNLNHQWSPRRDT
jgi:hypothetical protein